MQDPSTDLMDCLDWKHKHTCENQSLHALQIIRSGGDIHLVKDYYNQTCVHLALSCLRLTVDIRLLEVVQLLLEKGIDVNAQDWQGNTALHVTCCHYSNNVYVGTKLVTMLLYHGADPWIRNERNIIPLDWILEIKFRRIVRVDGVEKYYLVATLEHLYYHMFDQYTEFELSVDALLKAAVLDLPVFKEIVETIKEVDVDDLATNEQLDMEHILTMPPENLRLLLDKFDYVFKPLFLARGLNDNIYWWNEVRHENIYIFLESHLQREFIDWMNELKPRSNFLEGLFENPATRASREEIVYHLLSYGMETNGAIIDTVYEYCGYNDLFKLLRTLDLGPYPGGPEQLLPRLVFEVTGDIQKDIEDPRFWVNQITRKYSVLDFEPVLAYYAVPNLKDLCCEVMGEDKFFTKLDDQPRIPLLVELARNVFRKHFVQRLGITSAKQFYNSLELLPISSHHRKIIALETELY